MPIIPTNLQNVILVLNVKTNFIHTVTLHVVSISELFIVFNPLIREVFDLNACPTLYSSISWHTHCKNPQYYWLFIGLKKSFKGERRTTKTTHSCSSRCSINVLMFYTNVKTCFCSHFILTVV